MSRKPAQNKKMMNFSLIMAIVCLASLAVQLGLWQLIELESGRALNFKNLVLLASQGDNFARLSIAGLGLTSFVSALSGLSLIAESIDAVASGVLMQGDALENNKHIGLEHLEKVHLSSGSNPLAGPLPLLVSIAADSKIKTPARDFSQHVSSPAPEKKQSSKLKY